MNSTEIIRFLNEKQELARLLSNAFSGIKVIFGKENDTFSITNSSMVVSPYKIGEAPGGSLGIIGPLRVRLCEGNTVHAGFFRERDKASLRYSA